ncbi:hypothetical protein COCON_G00056300, partial [Conger conger]
MEKGCSGGGKGRRRSSRFSAATRPGSQWDGAARLCWSASSTRTGRTVWSRRRWGITVTVQCVLHAHGGGTLLCLGLRQSPAREGLTLPPGRAEKVPEAQRMMMLLFLLQWGPRRHAAAVGEACRVGTRAVGMDTGVTQGSRTGPAVGVCWRGRSAPGRGGLPLAPPAPPAPPGAPSGPWSSDRQRGG